MMQAAPAGVDLFEVGDLGAEMKAERRLGVVTTDIIRIHLGT